MLRALILGAVQGLTEFLPISSSGHLVLVPFVLGWDGGTGFQRGVSFDVAVPLGTALAVVVYFRRELWAIISGTVRVVARRDRGDDRDQARLALLLAVGSIPAAAAGLLLEGFFVDLFEEPPIAALLLLVTAGLLLTGEAIHDRQGEPRRGLADLRMADALTVGAFQALAIAPGISRSGATIVAGLGRRLERDAAARFSFLLALPAIVGAGILKIPDFPAGTDLGPVIGAMIVSAGAGFAAIAFLLRYLRTRTLRPFAVYCVLASAVALTVWLVR
ncbi:MAG TPA: undecaprenyl-diphosphate phosphatase [Actinomycetota bacterium]